MSALLALGLHDITAPWCTCRCDGPHRTVWAYGEWACPIAITPPGYTEVDPDAPHAVCVECSHALSSGDFYDTLTCAGCTEAHSIEYRPATRAEADAFAVLQEQQRWLEEWVAGQHTTACQCFGCVALRDAKARGAA